MKSIAISVLMLSMSFFFVSCENEGQLTQNTSDLETQSLGKKIPNGEKSEVITFVGDLAGSQVVRGCCPNAGSFPAYTLTLSGPLPAGKYDGNIFMNKVGRRSNQSYMVQFWWTEGDNDYFIEIRGGAVQEDKKNKTLTATFTNEPCVIDDNTVLVSFVLTRAPQ